jgi:uncharacterized protein YwgA
MRDAAIALATASVYEQRLNRIKLQKFIYLLDIVGYMYEVLPPATNHMSYNNGPYDPAIQNAVDSLAFRGLVEISDVETLPGGNFSSHYTLTLAGEEWVKTLAEQSVFKLRFEAASIIGKKVENLGWWRLKALAYAEPTYAQKRYSGFGQRIDVTDGTKNTAAYLIGIFNCLLEERNQNSNLNRELAIELFFRFLDSYDKTANQTNIRHGNANQ